MITDPVKAAIRKALIEDDEIAQRLEAWKNEPAAFTRRPVPHDAPDRIAIIDENSISDMDGLTSDRPIWQGKIAFYGKKGEPGTPQDDTRKVEQLGDLARELFHRQRFSVQIAGFSVIDIVAGGPVPGPTDDDNEVARIVSLRIRLRRN